MNQHINLTMDSENLSLITTDDLKAELWLEYYKQNKHGDTQLHIFIANFLDYTHMIRRLIDITQHPALLDIPNDDGVTALHLAAIKKLPTVVRWLIIAGANPIARDNFGWSPLHYGCEIGNASIAKAILIPLSDDETKKISRFARFPPPYLSLKMRNSAGQTPLHVAVEKGHLHVVKLLILLGANTETKEYSSGNIPLEIAILKNDKEMTKFFLDYYESNPTPPITHHMFSNIGHKLREMGLHEQFSKSFDLDFEWKSHYSNL